MSEHDLATDEIGVAIDSSMVRNSHGCLLFFPGNLFGFVLNPVRPLSMTIAGALFFLTWMWLSLSTMDYEANAAYAGFRTGGWFIFGLPINIAFAVIFALPFTMLARNGKPFLAGVLLFAVSISLVGYTFYQSTPVARLNRALEVTIPTDTRINTLRETESFNDGSTVFGVISTGPDILELLGDHHALKTQFGASSLLQQLTNDSIPHDAQCYYSERLSLYYDMNAELLFFVRRFP